MSPRCWCLVAIAMRRRSDKRNRAQGGSSPLDSLDSLDSFDSFDSSDSREGDRGRDLD